MKYQKPAEMSDSSIGDSLFSYPAQRRYFGSAESCRFGYECRRCSYDGEKCSFSDNCRYECRNCDCSSSYFSSDFDETNFSRQNSARLPTSTAGSMQFGHHVGRDQIDSKTNRYAEDFIKHIANVKKNTIYQASAGMTPSSVVMQQQQQQHHVRATITKQQHVESGKSAGENSVCSDRYSKMAYKGGHHQTRQNVLRSEEDSSDSKGAIPKQNCTNFVQQQQQLQQSNSPLKKGIMSPIKGSTDVGPEQQHSSNRDNSKIISSKQQSESSKILLSKKVVAAKAVPVSGCGEVEAAPPLGMETAAVARRKSERSEDWNDEDDDEVFVRESNAEKVRISLAF